MSSPQMKVNAMLPVAGQPAAESSSQHADALSHPVTAVPPPVSQFADLKPSDLLGTSFVILGCALTGLSLLLSTSSLLPVWLVGQILLAVSLLQWFAILHEAGHKTLFRRRQLNVITGHLAGFFAGFPFECWRLIHGMHHRWTGWQDLDATTAGLVPRPRPAWVRFVVRFCWRFWIPLFAVIYRLDNYWNLPRLHRLFQRKRSTRRLVVNIGLLLSVYGLVIYVVGPWTLLKLIGPGVVLSLMMEDLLILSQHTHIPMKVSGGEDVDPVPALEQEIFTRSLRFPAWFSLLFLLNLDAHELHHMYVQVPGYYLNRVQYVPHNQVSWWQWVVKSRRIPGDVLLFQNRDQTGFEI